MLRALEAFGCEEVVEPASASAIESGEGDDWAWDGGLGRGGGKRTWLLSHLSPGI